MKWFIVFMSYIEKSCG